MLHRHPTFFPLVLVFLTLGLVGFMVVMFAKPSSFGEKVSPTISEDAYRLEMKEFMASFETRYQAASDDLKKVVLVENTLNKLLSIKVPETYKDLHLELAFSLNAIREGLREKSAALAEGEQRLKNLLAKESWLR